MIIDRNLSIEEIIDALTDTDIECEECELIVANAAPFEMTSRDYLEFAGLSLLENSEMARINALANAKRAIECRFDELLWASNLRSFSMKGRWNLREKAAALHSLDILAPQVLKKISSQRNLLEHEYKKSPSKEELNDLKDIVELFLAATESYLKSVIIEASLYCNPMKGSELEQWAVWTGQKEALSNGEQRYRDVYEILFDYEDHKVWLRHSSLSPSITLRNERYNELSVLQCGKQKIIALMRKLREEGFISTSGGDWKEAYDSYKRRWMKR